MAFFCSFLCWRCLVQVLGLLNTELTLCGAGCGNMVSVGHFLFETSPDSLYVSHRAQNTKGVSSFEFWDSFCVLWDFLEPQNLLFYPKSQQCLCFLRSSPCFCDNGKRLSLHCYKLHPSMTQQLHSVWPEGTNESWKAGQYIIGTQLSNIMDIYHKCCLRQVLSRTPPVPIGDCIYVSHQEKHDRFLRCHTKSLRKDLPYF